MPFSRADFKRKRKIFLEMIFKVILENVLEKSLTGIAKCALGEDGIADKGEGAAFPPSPLHMTHAVFAK